MLCNIDGLRNYSLRATDGEIGTVEDFYFDDQAWAVRYLQVDTGKWLPGRKVLISPLSLGRVDLEAKAIEVKLTKSQVEKSPDIDTHKPISRQHEMTLFNYYGYPYYWPGPYLWGPVPYPAGVPGPTERGTLGEEIRAAEEREEEEDQHLRSAREVTNYTIEASDGEIGHVEDFLVSDEDWAIRYILVDTRNWWPGKKVVVSPRWIREVSWPDKKVHVDLSRESIKNSPEYDASASFSRDYEERLHEHYRRPRYWKAGTQFEPEPRSEKGEGSKRAGLHR